MKTETPLSKILKEKEYFGYKVATPETKAISKPRAKSKGIQNEELIMMIDSIKEVFGDEVFMNKDFAPKGLIEKWELTARQTPSRLKKLVEQGLLVDHGGSPKSYQVKA